MAARPRTLLLTAVAALLLPGPAWAVVPNDPQFGNQWGLHNTGQTVAGAAGTADADIDAVEAWNLTTGGPGVTVAVVDGGVDPTQEDVAPNLDVASGYDFGQDDEDPTEDPGSIHGTQVMSVIGARGDNALGMAGVAWVARLMPLKIRYPPSGGTTSAGEAAAFRYAGEHGARVVNASFSLGPDRNSPAVVDAIRDSPDTLFVSSAGNPGSNGTVSDNDVSPRYPCNYDLPNHLCVGGTDENDALWSNYGARSVDLAGPATNVEVVMGPTSYGQRDGTSFSTAMVSGVAALYFARYPGATVADVRNALLQGVDVLPSLAGKMVSDGRLNAARTLAIPPAGSPPPPPPPPPPTPTPTPGSGARPHTGAAASGCCPAVGAAATATPSPGGSPAVAPRRGGPSCGRSGFALGLGDTQRLRTVLRRGLRLRLDVARRTRVVVRVGLAGGLAQQRDAPALLGSARRRRPRRTTVIRVPFRPAAKRALRGRDGVRVCVSVRTASGRLLARDGVTLRQATSPTTVR